MNNMLQFTVLRKWEIHNTQSVIGNCILIVKKKGDRLSDAHLPRIKYVRHCKTDRHQHHSWLKYIFDAHEKRCATIVVGGNYACRIGRWIVLIDDNINRRYTRQVFIVQPTQQAYAWDSTWTYWIQRHLKNKLILW